MEDSTTDGTPKGPQFLGSFNSKGERVSDAPSEPAPEPAPTQAPTETPVETPAETPKPDAPAPVDYLKIISEKTGFQFQAEDELINEIKSSRDLKSKFNEYESELNKYKAIDPRALEIDQVLKSGTDLDLFLEAKKLDVEGMDGKQAMYHKFLRENPGMNREYAELLFEEDYNQKYSVLSQPFDDSAISDPMDLQQKKLEFEKKKKLAQLDRDHKQKEAKRFLSQWKAERTKVQEVKPVDQEKLFNHFKTQAEQIVSQSEKFEIPVDGKTFNFGMDGFKNTLKEKLSNPLEAFKELGYDATKDAIDLSKVAEALKALHIVKNIGKPLKDWSLEQFNIQTVAAQLQKPAPPQPIAGGVIQKTHDQKFGEAFLAAFQSQEQLDR